jgi:hypothetical protein
MRITENTPSHLRLRDRTLWISGVCSAAAVVLAAPAALDRDQLGELIPAALSAMVGLAFLRATNVMFDKVERICEIYRFDVLRVSRTRLAFADIVDARVEIGPSPGDSPVISCRLSLVTGSAVVPLTGVTSLINTVTTLCALRCLRRYLGMAQSPPRSTRSACW